MQKLKSTGKNIKLVTKRSRTRDYQEYLVESLRDPDEAAAYLNAVVEESLTDDPKSAQSLILLALRNIAEAKLGMSRLAKIKRLNRAALYRSLSKSGNPRLESFFKVLDAVGLELAVKPKQ